MSFYDGFLTFQYAGTVVLFLMFFVLYRKEKMSDE